MPTRNYTNEQYKKLNSPNVGNTITIKHQQKYKKGKIITLTYTTIGVKLRIKLY